MCGIIGLVDGNAFATADRLVRGLRKLEYRGYDSAGICIENAGTLFVRKSVGTISDLERKNLNDAPTGHVGIGHCLHPDTFVQLADGRVVRIRDLQREEVLSAGLESWRFSEKTSACGRHSSPSTLFHLKTASFSLRCTGEHRLFAVDPSGAIVERKVKGLRAGDLLVSTKRFGIQGESQPLRPVEARRYYRFPEKRLEKMRETLSASGKSVPQLARELGFSRGMVEHALRGDRRAREDVALALCEAFAIPSSELVGEHSAHGNFVFLPEKTSPPLLQFLGYLTGDGYVSDRFVRFKDARREVLVEYERLGRELFGLPSALRKISSANAWELRFSSLPLSNWLRTNFSELCLRRRAKEIPPFIGKTTNEEIAAFLRGLFDAEGCVNLSSRQVLLRMNNEPIIRVVQLYLLRLGILASFSQRPTLWGESFGLSLNNHDALLAFSEKIGFTVEEKRARLLRVLEKMEGFAFQTKVFPLSYANIRAAYGHVNVREVRGTSTTHLTQRGAQKLLQSLRVSGARPELATALHHFLTSDIVFQRLESIVEETSDTTDVYDLYVPDTHNFIANGFVSHNSRWATHGGVTEANAHPHLSCDESVAIVHNGVIENFAELRSDLQARGHEFRSQTDSEVFAHLIEEFQNGGDALETAVGKAAKLARGSLALLVVSTREPRKLVAARRESPLLIAKAKTGAFLAASDALPLLEYTNQFTAMEDGELAILEPHKLSFTTFDGKGVRKTFTTVTWKVGESDLGGFEHFMQKEINEEPASLLAALKQDKKAVESFAADVKRAKRVILVACGTARHAALIGRYLFNKVAGRFGEVMIGSEFPYFSHEVDENTIVLAVSQSGETADVLQGVRQAKARGAKIYSIVNVVGSTLARESDKVLYINCGPEIGVAATKSFINQLAVFYLVAFAMRGEYDRAQAELTEISKIAGRVVYENDAKARKLAQRLKTSPSAYFIARGINYAVAIEGALKLKEISYVHAEGMPAGELKHGTLALIEKDVPVLAINPLDYTHDETITNIMETKARGAYVIGISDEPNPVYDELLRIPKVDPFYYPLVCTIPLQLLAYYTGVARGVNVDRPRNLAKSVTVR